ncbi:hypothetical protein [Lysobacter sp. Root494]|uniref:hypothetical protein n=1 Tax=Lysobacter sp. Root494 TaxID=1736549 RepID=UPI0007012DA1|nr:hypothetical protein [Lysobacter sp. Root494]KQY51853.1 hypothetical protein ASD14_04020 [Lysobacter sp. Root494]
MKPELPFLGTALLCLGLAACSQAESRNATTAADNVVGILQCDDYLAKVNTCIHERVPADRRAALAAEAHQMFATWKEAAADPEHRATLPQACGITLEVAKEDLARYGCTF